MRAAGWWAAGALSRSVLGCGTCGLSGKEEPLREDPPLGPGCPPLPGQLALTCVWFIVQRLRQLRIPTLSGHWTWGLMNE